MSAREPDGAERLHKLLARAGVASLRASERLIREGRVRVNGAVVDTPGAAARPTDAITVDGQPLRGDDSPRYVLLNKPRGVLSTAHDDLGRTSVLDLVDAPERLYPVGRLDRDSEGLMLLTNDGALAERLLHPRYGLHREYRVDVEGEVTPRQLDQLLLGVELEDGPSSPVRARILAASPDRSALLLTLDEGRNRQIRRMIEALGLRVLRLVRVGLGPLGLGDLASGRWRELEPGELRALRRAAELGHAREAGR